VIVAVDGEPGSTAGQAGGSAGFEVHLDVFEGPFDLLLGLISKHKLDITEVALSQVTDEFIGYIGQRSGGWDLDQVSYFLVVAATLLDLKAARLLPSGEVEDEEDLALLEARDLLFARLLQYRAYKEVAAVFAGRMAAAAKRFRRRVPLEPRFAELLPEVLLGVGPEQFARIAARALAPKPVPTVSVDHIHAPKVSVREHAIILRERLARLGSANFRTLTHDCQHTLEVVARFLALLELYREGLVAFEQLQALGELTVRWTGPEDGSGDLTVDEYVGAPPTDATPATPATPASPVEDEDVVGGTG
jgi:segregation and condensation protein A